MTEEDRKKFEDALKGLSVDGFGYAKEALNKASALLYDIAVDNANDAFKKNTKEHIDLLFCSLLHLLSELCADCPVVQKNPKVFLELLQRKLNRNFLDPNLYRNFLDPNMN